MTFGSEAIRSETVSLLLLLANAAQRKPERKFMMKRTHLFRGMMVASFVSLSMSAYAQTPTPPQSQQAPGTPGSTMTQPMQGGMQAPAPMGTTPSAGAMSNTPQNSGTTNSAMQTNDKMQMSKAYVAARKLCESMPAAQMGACAADANKKYSSVDPKCRSISGMALNDCLGVNDRVN